MKSKHKRLFNGMVKLFFIFLFLLSCNKGTVMDTSSEETNDEGINVSREPGKFGFIMLKDGLSKEEALKKISTSQQQTSITINLGDVKITRSYYFLLVNTGGAPITNITLSCPVTSFLVEPQAITSLDPLDQGTNLSLLPVIKVTVEHGVSPNGVGYTNNILSPGQHTATLTIQGTTVDANNNSIPVTLEVNLSVIARVVDVQLSDGNNNILTPLSSSETYIFYNQMQVPYKYETPPTLKVTNTGNIDLTINLFMLSNYNLQPITITNNTLPPNQTLTLELSDYSQNEIRHATFLLEIDGNNTIVSPSSSIMQSLTTGKGYIALSKQCTDSLVTTPCLQ